MAATPLPSFEVFTPVQADELPEEMQFFQPLAARMEEVVNNLFATIEANALPPPAEATVASETIALLGVLPLRDAEYDIGSGYTLDVTGSFGVPFATAAEWGEPAPGKKSIEPVVEVATSVTVRTERSSYDELFESVLAMRRRSQEEERVISKHKSLMGVEGTRGGRWPRRQYTYDSEQQAGVREQIGRAIAQDETAQVDAYTVVREPVSLGFMLKSSSPPLDLCSTRRMDYRTGIVEPTAPELVVPTLRVVRELMIRSVDAQSSTANP